MNEISGIKVYCVSLSNKAASNRRIHSRRDIYIDSAVRLENGTVVFSTKEGNVYVIRNKKEAEKIYPVSGSGSRIGKLQAVSKPSTVLDYNSDSYVSMAYMDFPQEVLYQKDDDLWRIPKSSTGYSRPVHKLPRSCGGLAEVQRGYRILYGSINN